MVGMEWSRVVTDTFTIVWIEQSPSLSTRTGHLRHSVSRTPPTLLRDAACSACWVVLMCVGIFRNGLQTANKNYLLKIHRAVPKLYHAEEKARKKSSCQRPARVDRPHSQNRTPTALCVKKTLTLIRDAACCARGAYSVALVWVGLLETGRQTANKNYLLKIHRTVPELYHTGHFSGVSAQFSQKDPNIFFGGRTSPTGRVNSESA